jgi:hypothetical protein
MAIEAIRRGINATGMQITGEEFKMSATGQIATGRFFIGNLENDLQRCLGYINSYNKTKAVGLAAGANVFICANGMFTSELVTLRKHTPNVLRDLEGMISKVLGFLEESFVHALESKKYFQLVNLNRSAINEIIGQLYLEEELIKDRQISIIKDGMFNDINFNMQKEPTMWNLYNLITESFKKSHSGTYIKDHVDLHNYFYDKIDEWGLGGAPKRVSIVKQAPIIHDIFPVIEDVLEVKTLELAELPESEFKRIDTGFVFPVHEEADKF